MEASDKKVMENRDSNPADRMTKQRRFKGAHPVRMTKHKRFKGAHPVRYPPGDHRHITVLLEEPSKKAAENEGAIPIGWFNESSEDDDSFVLDLATVKPLKKAAKNEDGDNEENGRSESAAENEDDDSFVIDLATVKSLMPTKT
jgi:hypothetical protein